MTDSLRQQVIDEQYVAYQKGARSWLGLIPMFALPFAFPFAASTEWGAEYLGFSPLIYGISMSLFVVGVAAATWAHKTKGSLSKLAMRLEALETAGSSQASALLVLGSGMVGNAAWVFMAIAGLLTIPVASKTRGPLWVYFASLACLVVIFTVRDGWWSGLIAIVIAIACVIPMHPLLGYQRQNLETEIGRRELLQKLTDVQVELERQRISRGLHDGLTGQLTATLWLLRGARAQIPDELAQNLEHRLYRCLIELRSAVWNVDDAPVELGAVAGRISRIPELLMDERVQVKCDIVDPRRTISAQQASLLLAASLELTFNALREKTSVVSVWLQNGVVLVVEDDGPGLTNTLPEGGGILSIRHRLQSAGGELHIESLPGKTTMRVVFAEAT